MDKEALRRQLEDMEQASERWRTEKRRLNTEIDKLETALADAKTASSRKRAAADSKAQGIDPVALAKMQQAAEEKLTAATAEWEAERTKLKSQINRLEGAVAEAIARAANPMRATISVKEQFEVELSRVAKEKTELEQAFLRGKTEWEQEKLKMTGEMVKLRRAAQIMGHPVPKKDAPEVNPKVIDLEKQVKDNFTQWNAERERLAGQIQKLEESSRHWDAERRQLNDHAAQVQQSLVQAQAKVQGHEAASRAPHPSDALIEELKRESDMLHKQFRENSDQWNAERQRLTAQIQRLEEAARLAETDRKRVNDHAAQLQQAFVQAQTKIEDYQSAAKSTNPSDELIGEMNQENEALQSQLQESQTRWSQERRELNSQIERLEQQLQRTSDSSDRVSNEVVDQLRKQYEQRLQEAIKQKTQLTQDLQNASSLLESERTRLSAAHADGGGHGMDPEAISAEVSRVESLLNQIVGIIDNPDTDLSTVIRKNVEKAELDAYLKGILFSIGKK